MATTLSLPPDTYEVLEQLATARGKTPEAVVRDLLDAAWEAECAKYDSAFEQDPDWQESARQAEAGELTDPTHFASTEEFFRHLGADDERIEAASHLSLGSVSGHHQQRSV